MILMLFFIELFNNFGLGPFTFFLILFVLFIKIDIYISLRLPCICVCRLKAVKCGKYFCCNSQPYFSFSVQGWGRAGPPVFLLSKHKLHKMFKFKRRQLEHFEDGCYKEWYTPPLFLAAKIKQNPKGFPAAYLEVKIYLKCREKVQKHILGICICSGRCLWFALVFQLLQGKVGLAVDKANLPLVGADPVLQCCQTAI